MPVGRPLKFKSVEELQEKIDAYFGECDPHWIDQEYWEHPEKVVSEDQEPQAHGGSLKRKRTQLDYDAPLVLKTRKHLTNQVPYTITGLALALDTTRETLLDYEEKEEYSDTIKKAKLKIHNYTELRLFENNPTGAIFNLKNNYGWKDKTEVDNHHSGEVVFTNDVPRPKAD